jgi:hypothetical protein
MGDCQLDTLGRKPAMKYRVHIYVSVRVEFELEADSPAEAASKAIPTDRTLYERFDRAGEEYTEEIDGWCLVDPLTDEADCNGRLVPDYENSQWFETTQSQGNDDRPVAVVGPEPTIIVDFSHSSYDY